MQEKFNRYFFIKNCSAWWVLIIALSVCTSFLLWESYGHGFTLSSVREIWLAQHQPESAFHYVLRPFAFFGDFGVFIFLTLVHAYIAWQFVWIGERIGIGRGSLLILFLFLNFGLEYNDMRLYVDAWLLFLVCWLTAVSLFLYWQERNLILAFVLWALCMWVSVLFELSGLFWAVVFPLLFLFWPRHRPWRFFGERERVLSIYYALLFFLILLVPYWRGEVIALWNLAKTQFARASLDMAIYINADQSLELGFARAYFMSLVLVFVKVFEVAGLPVFLLLFLSWRRRMFSVMKGRVRLFFYFALCFALLSSALGLLYWGRIQPDLAFVPVMLLLLWLSAGGAFYVQERLQRVPVFSERFVIGAWLLVAYILASLWQFGSSTSHFYQAGRWAVREDVAVLYSNSPDVLYYAGRSPMPDAPFLADFSSWQGEENAVFALALSRREVLPEEVRAHWEVLQEFSNRRGLRVFMLRKL